MRPLPYAQLLRLPNVFTAFADILMGTLAAGTLLHRPLAAVLLLLASACLYCSGMVWNDYFDFEIDRKERPFRPLPSGKIARSTARGLGMGLMLLGLGFAGMAGWGADGSDGRPVVLAAALVAAIFFYDVWLKHTPIGPVTMGTCRFLNVLVATSLADASVLPSYQRVHLALVVGIYIIGVTWFARGEAGQSLAANLRGAAAVMLAALVLALALPARLSEGSVTIAYPYLLVAFGFLIGIPIVRAIARPEPQLVQAAVKRCILGLVALDALMLGRRVYST
jgi:4-hydroxybenzoate polyprenyltransferase